MGDGGRGAAGPAGSGDPTLRPRNERRCSSSWKPWSAAASRWLSQIDDPELASQFRRTSLCLVAARDVVEAGVAAGPAGGSRRIATGVDRQRLAACLDRMDAIAKKSPAMGAWKTYLLCDLLRELASGTKAYGEDAVQLAQRVLDRLTRVPMDPQQQAFVNGEAISALARCCSGWWPVRWTSARCWNGWSGSI